MMEERDRQRIETRLRREREAVLEAIGQFEERDAELRDRAGEISAYRTHPADLGTEAHEEEKEQMLASMEGRRLYAIDDALRRLYAEPERFGVCERCGREIEAERLDVIPETTLCAADARAGDAEAERLGNAREASPEADR
jgi:RNA polymerase-binding transcription factor DksA